MQFKSGPLFLLLLAFLFIKTSCVPVPSTSQKATEVGFSSKAPRDNGANPKFQDEYDWDGSDILVSWIPFSDDVKIVNHRIYTFADSSCSLGKIDHGLSGSQINAAVISGLPEGRRWMKVEAQNASGGIKLSECSTDSILIDGTAPSAPTGVTLNNPVNGSTSNSLTPVVSGSAVGERGATVRLFKNNTCSQLIGTTTVQDDQSFIFNSFSLNSNGTDDGVNNFYIHLEDRAFNLSNCFDLSLGYTLDSQIPKIVSLSVPTSRGYKFGATLTFTLNLSENVYVNGNPRLKLKIAGQDKFASYASGSGTTALVFNYAVDTVSNDFDGIELEGLVDLNGGTITDVGNNNLKLDFTVPTVAGITIDNINPTISIIEKPAPKKYVYNQTLNFTVNFSEAVYLTGGNPTIALDIGGNSKNLTYVSGSGTSNWTFSYTIEAGLDDTDGISIATSLAIPGGVEIKDEAGNPFINGFSNVDLSLVTVDSSAPQLTITAPSNGTYKNAQKLEFTASASETINVSGLPRIQMDIGGSTKYAVYKSGSGSTSIKFEYYVDVGLEDSDGITLTSPIDLNSGEIIDAVGNNAILTYTLPTTTGVLVDSKTPTISSVTVPSNGTYKFGDNLSFTIVFSEIVNVTVPPRLVLDIGGNTKYANYSSGTGTNTLVFVYSIESGLEDKNGISIGASIDLNGGNLLDVNSNPVVLNFSPIDTRSILVDSIAPTISSVRAPDNGSYNSSLDFKINFNEKVYVVTTGGSPTISIDVGGTGRNLSYVSGSGTSVLEFNYTIAGGETDTDGISMSSPIVLPVGTTIKDLIGNDATVTFNLPDLTSVLVDTTSPNITSVTPPANKTHIFNEELVFVLNLDENVNVTGNPRLTLDINGTTKYANYFSGSGTSALTFKYPIEKGLTDNDGIGLTLTVDLNSGSIKDLSGNNLNLTIPAVALGAVNVDSVVPEITDLLIPSNAFYTPGQALTFTAVFNKVVNITNLPRMILDLDGDIVYASYDSGSGTTNIIFKYYVSNSVNDNNGISYSSSLELPSNSLIRGASGNNAVLSLPAKDVSGVKVDSGAPYILSVTPSPNGYYKNTEVLSYKVIFNETVIINGNPSISIGLGTSNVKVGYFSGTGTKEIDFKYIIKKGDNDLDGITTYSPIDFGFGTIKDGNNNSSLTAFLTPDTSGIFIDSQEPSVLSITAPIAGNYVKNDNLDFTITFSEPVTLIGSPELQLRIGGVLKTASYLSSPTSTTMSFRYVIEEGLTDFDGIELLATLDLNGGFIRDSALNDLNTDLSNILPNLSLVKVDSVVPYITNLELPAGKYYLIGEVLIFKVNFNEPVSVNSPKLNFYIGDKLVSANYVSGNNTNQLRFEYTVVASDNDNNGIALVSPLDLQGQQIQDSFLNNSTGSFNIPSTSSIKVDTGAPGPVSISLPSAGTYKGGDDLLFDVYFSEEVILQGGPYIEIDINGSTKKAFAFSRPSENIIQFKYQVENNLSDTDGIEVKFPIQLNFGQIKDGANNDSLLSLSNPDSSNIKIDSISPTISNLIVPPNKTYGYNEKLIFDIEFSENIAINNTPRLSLNINGVTKYASFTSLVNSKTARFEYAVELGLIDDNGIQFSLSSIDLNTTGTVTDVAGNDAVLTLPFVDISGVRINSDLPSISSLVKPPNNLFVSGNQLDFVLIFNKNVFVTGIPELQIDEDGTFVSAKYISGSGTSNLTFRYIVGATDNDNNGIVIKSPLVLNGGTLKDIYGNDAILTFSPPNASGILIDSGPPFLVSMTGPSDGRYKAGDALEVFLNFNETVSSTGGPTRIILDIGGTQKYATFVSGSGTKILKYRYLIENGLNDSDGIVIKSPIDKNGGAIVDSKPNGLASYIFTDIHRTQVFVDTVTPTIISQNIILPPDGNYVGGQNLDLKIQYNEVVYVSGGVPKLNLLIGGQNKTADYLSGSGTDTLTFRYSIESGLYDKYGASVSSPLNLNGATIADLAGNNSNNSFSSSVLSGILIDSQVPSISNITFPANAYYTTGNNLDITISFSEPIIYTGSPKLKINVGSQQKNVSLFSQSSNILVFRYTVAPGDNDNDGIVLVSPLDTASGTITDAAGNSATVSFGTPNSSGIKIDSGPPSITSINVPANGYYSNNKSLNFSINYNEVVVVTGTPRLVLDIDGDGDLEYANLINGNNSTKLNFSYTTLNPDEDTNGILFSSVNIDLNGGTIKDGNNNSADISLSAAPSMSSVLVDTVSPTITSVAENSIGPNYKKDSILSFKVTFSENVIAANNTRIKMDIGGSTQYASYSSGSGSNEIIYSLQIPEGLEDLDGITLFSPIELNGGFLRDIAGNNSATTYTIPNTSTIMVDSILPRILVASAPAGGTYTVGNPLNFSMTFSENVTVTNSPRIGISFDGSTKYANYTTTAGSIVNFSYTIASGDNDNNGIVLTSPIDKNITGTIIDGFGNEANYVFPTPVTSGIIVDSGPPTITSIGLPADGNYGTGGSLLFSVVFSETVNVVGGNLIHLNLNIGGNAKEAKYLNGDGSNILTFSYALESNISDSDGIDLLSPVDINGGTIRDGVPNDANLNFPLQNTAGIKVDTVTPTILSTSGPSSATYAFGQTLSFTVTYNENVIVSGLPSFNLDIGGVTKGATYQSGSGTPNLVFSYNIESGLLDSDGISYLPNFYLNGGSVVDTTGNNASSIISIDNLAGVNVDSIFPKINSITVASGNYKKDDVLSFTVNTSKNVVVTGSPVLDVLIGGITKQATYTSGSGTSSLIFNYTIEPELYDNDGVTLVPTVNLNGGSLKDTATNNLILGFSDITISTSSVLVDSRLPKVDSISLPTAKGYKQGENLYFDLIFNKDVTITGAPIVPITVGAATLNATYDSSVSSTTKRFRYTVGAGENDLDGISIGSSIDLQGGTITDTFLNNSSLTLPVVDSSSIFVDTTIATVVSVNPPANGSYRGGDNLVWTVVFSENLTLNGNLTLNLRVEGSDRTAVLDNFSGNTGTFIYSIESGVNDTDGVELQSMTLNSGTFVDVGGNTPNLGVVNTNYSGIVIDSARPSIIAKTVPNAGTYHTGDTLTFSVQFNENITISPAPDLPELRIDIGGTVVGVPYSSDSGTDTIYFSYILPSGLKDSDGITIKSIVLNAGYIRDSAANDAEISFTEENYPSVVIDSRGPLISSVNVPANNTYLQGQNLVFIFNLDEVGYSPDLNPRLELNVGGELKYATLQSGSTGTTSFTYIYTIDAGVQDTDGITLNSPIQLNGGSIKDILGNDGVLTFTPPDTSLIRIDGHPKIGSITLPSNKTYNEGENLDFIVNFNEVVTVIGSPVLRVNIGGSIKNAFLLSGNNSNMLTFRYTVGENDLDTDGIELYSTNTISLGTGVSIRDSGGKDAILNLSPLPNSSGILLDTAPPNIASLTFPSSGPYKSGEIIDIVVNYSRRVIVTGGIPEFNINIGGVTKKATYIGDSNPTQQLTFRYIVSLLDNDNNGIEALSPLLKNGSSIKSETGTDAGVVFTSPSSPIVKIDNTPPVGSISINNGDVGTSSLSVLLNLTATDDLAIEMYITNNSSCASGGAWEPFSSSKSWNLSNAESTNSVYVKFRDSKLNESNCYNDTIIHDTIGPSISISNPSLSAVGTGSTVDYYVSYNDASQIFLTTNKIVLNKTGTVNIDSVTVNSNTNPRVVTLSGFTGDGSVSISISPGSAEDSVGNLSASAGPSVSFTVDATAPGIPGPMDFDDPDLVTNNGNSIGVTWTTASDTNSSSLKYRLETFTDNLCSVLNANHGDTPATNPSSSASLITGLNQGTYWGRVTAIDIGGNETPGPCSTESIIVNTIAPIDNGANPQFTNDVSTTGNNVELTWTAFSDEDQSRLDHDIELYKDPSGCTVNKSIFTTGSANNNDNGVLDNLIEGIYHAKVVAKNTIGLSTTSACSTDTITIDNEPRRNVLGDQISFTQNGDNDGNDIDISWGAFDDVSLSNHKIHIYDDSGCTSLINTFTTNSALNSDTTNVDGLASDKIYYAKIEAIDGINRTNLTDCSLDSIVVDYNPPVINFIDGTNTNGIIAWDTNPINSSVALSGNFPASSFTDFDINLNYSIRFYNATGCSESDFVKSISINNSTFSIADSELITGDYYTKIRAVDDANNITDGPCSSELTGNLPLTIDNSKPSIDRYTYTTGVLNNGDDFEFRLFYNEPLTIVAPGPVIKIEIAGVEREFTYSGLEDGDKTVVLTHTINYNDKDQNGVRFVDIEFENTRIKDAAGNFSGNITIKQFDIFDIIINDTVLTEGRLDFIDKEPDVTTPAKYTLFENTSASCTVIKPDFTASATIYMVNTGSVDVTAPLNLTLDDNGQAGIWTTGTTNCPLIGGEPYLPGINVSPGDDITDTTKDCSVEVIFNASNSAVTGQNYTAWITVTGGDGQTNTFMFNCIVIDP